MDPACRLRLAPDRTCAQGFVAAHGRSLGTQVAARIHHGRACNHDPRGHDTRRTGPYGPAAGRVPGHRGRVRSADAGCAGARLRRRDCTGQLPTDGIDRRPCLAAVLSHLCDRVRADTRRPARGRETRLSTPAACQTPGTPLRIRTFRNSVGTSANFPQATAGAASAVSANPGSAPMAATTPLRDIPGTTIFGAQQARRGYALNRMCFSFNDADNRAAFLKDEEAYCTSYGLDPAQRDAVRRRDVLALIEAGGNIYYLAKLAGIFHLGVQDIGAQQTGMTLEGFKTKLSEAGK